MIGNLSLLFYRLASAELGRRAPCLLAVLGHSDAMGDDAISLVKPGADGRVVTSAKLGARLWEAPRL